MIAAEAERRLAAAITSALSDVEGSTDHITTLKQALHAKQVQKKQALLQANAELDNEISDMLASRVEDWEEDWQHRQSEVTPGQLYHRAMIDYESEVKKLDEKAENSKHRLEQALGARAAMRHQQKQERDLAEQKKQMEARLLRAQDCAQRYQAKVRRAVHNTIMHTGTPLHAWRTLQQPCTTASSHAISHHVLAAHVTLLHARRYRHCATGQCDRGSWQS